MPDLPLTLPGDLVSPTAGPILFLGGWLVETRVIVYPDGGFDRTTGVIVGSTGGPSRMVWAHAWCEARKVALSDLAIPLDHVSGAGMDLAARWLARHHGLTVGATAPRFEEDEVATGAFEEREEDGQVYDAEVATRSWVLSVPVWDEFKPQTRRFSSVPQASWFVHPCIIVPGISALTDPAEALALACLAAGGR